MYEAVDRKHILITSSFFILIPILMTMKEFPTLSAAQHLPYLIGRGAIILASLTYFVLALFGTTPRHYPVAIYIISIGYAIHGQFFEADYWLAFIEVNTVYPVFFFPSRQVLIPLYILGLLGFDTAFLLSSGEFIRQGIFNELVRNDIVIGTIITSSVTLISYNSFTLIRIKRNLLLQRFIDVGKNFSFIMHDIKGMISTPTLYATMLEKSVTNNTFTDNEKSLFKFLREDLGSIKDFVFQINKLVSAEFSDEDRRPSVRVSESTDLTKTLLKSKLKNIKVNQVGDMEISTKLENLNRILINAMVNSIDALTRSKVKDGEITVTCADNVLTVTDNSGTQLTNEVLRKLNNANTTFTDKANGSGLGTMIIKDFTKAMGGRVVFSNAKTGVLLTVTFPRQLMRKPPPQSKVA